MRETTDGPCLPRPTIRHQQREQKERPTGLRKGLQQVRGLSSARVCAGGSDQARFYGPVQPDGDRALTGGFACRLANFLSRFPLLNRTSNSTRNQIWAQTKHLNMPNMPATRTARNKWA